MKGNKKTFAIICITALITCLLTNTYRDIMFVQKNGKINYKVSSVANILNEYSIFDIDEEKAADYAAIGMASAVDDIYTVYYPEDEFSSYKTILSNSFCGVGVTIVSDIENDRIVVESVVEGSPAEKAGITKGDVIIGVDDTKFSANQLSEAADAMSGANEENPKGTIVKVTVERNGERIDCFVTRDEVKINSVTEKMITGTKIGYMRISAFNIKDQNSENALDTYDEFVESLEILRESGMEKLIIDLRGNPGGSLDIVTKIADEILPEGIVTYTLDKKGKRVDYTSKEGELNIPIAVLVNGESASAAEVLTGALKDYEKATVIGTKTYGKGIVQTVFPLNDGSGLSVTTSKYYSPKGNCIHEIGIEPDMVVEMDKGLDISTIGYDSDIQLKKAVEYLKSN